MKVRVWELGSLNQNCKCDYFRPLLGSLFFSPKLGERRGDDNDFYLVFFFLVLSGVSDWIPAKAHYYQIHKEHSSEH